MDEHHANQDRGGARTRTARRQADERSGAAAAERVRRAQRTHALIDLLEDDAAAVWRPVQDELVRAGRASRSRLAGAARSSRARLRARARATLAAIDRREVLRRLHRLAARDDVDLEQALFLLARLDTPRLDARPYRRALDAMAAEVRRRSLRRPRGLARPMVLVQYLAGELGFEGGQEDFHHPDNIHLHRTIERRRGMPLTLTAIYVFVARRCGLRASAVPLPGHVMLRLYDDETDDDRSILVDPFRRGRVRTRRECREYLAQHGLAIEPSWFRDADDGTMFLRHVMNLRNSANKRGLEVLARELYKVAQTVARTRQRRKESRSG